jgi:hypothetical protein
MHVESLACGRCRGRSCAARLGVVFCSWGAGTMRLEQPALKQVLLGLLTLAMAGCSNEPVTTTSTTTDFTSAFTGNWVGSTTITVAGQSSTNGETLVPMIRTGINALTVGGLCDDASGPPATVTSATTFTIGSTTCPPVAVTGCSSVVLSTQSGRGLLSDSAALVIIINGTIAGCGQSFPFALFFRGAKQGGLPLPPPPQLAFSPFQLNLDERSPNQGPGPFAALTLTNSGGSTAVEVGFQVLTTGNASPDELVVDTSACPSDLNAGESCTVRVAFSPTSFGAETFQLVASEGSGLSATAYISGSSGRFVQVNLIGGGRVTSQPAGIDCPGQCYAVFSDGTALVFTATVPSANSLEWSGGCTPSGDECSTTVNSDLQLTARMSPWLNIFISQASGLRGGVRINGGESCAFDGLCSLAISGPVTLTALLDPIMNSSESYFRAVLFQGWTGACAGTGIQCQLSVNGPTQVYANFVPLNDVFVTTAALDAAGAGADTACAAGRPAQYRAWLASSVRNPADLLRNEIGWESNSDQEDPGHVQALGVDELTSGRMRRGLDTPFTPLSEDLATGAALDGSSLGQALTCNDWTSLAGTYPVGSTFSGGHTWAVDIGATPAPCGNPALVVCFGTGATGTLLLPMLPSPARVAFLSTSWTPSGLANADAQCAADAASAGLTGTFRALLNSDAARFPVTGLWVRTDGVPVLADTPWNRSSFHGVLDLDAHANVVVPPDLLGASVWIPAGNWGNFVTTEDCQNWAGGAGITGSIERFDRPGIEPTTRPCSEAHRLYCLQVP